MARLACEAMRCRFELLVTAAEPARARAAGQAAIDEILRIEAWLSPFEPSSEVSGLNASAGRPVTVGVELMRLLLRCRALHELTAGAFDPMVGPLLRLWGLRGAVAGAPTPEALAEALAASTLARVELDPEGRTVRLAAGMALDLGAIGKGYAVDRAAAVLAELGCGGLIHGGTSSVAAVGPQEWPVAIADPGGDQTLGVRRLTAETLSVSRPAGRTVTVDGQRIGHIIDPRTGRPVAGCRLAAVVTASAADGDALSTALLVEGTALLPRLEAALPDLVALVVDETGLTHRRGEW